MTEDLQKARFHAMHLLAVNRYRDALQTSQKALREFPDDVALNVLAAKAATELEEFDLAEAHLQMALTIEPDDYLARAVLVDLNIEREEYAQAELVLIDLIRENPGDANLLATYAQLMLRTLNIDKARALSKEALSRDPDSPRANVVATLVDLIDGDRIAARAKLSRLIADDPEAEHVAWVLISVLSEEQQFDEALIVAKELLRKYPDNPDLVDVIIESRVASHFLMVPYRFLIKYGYGGSAVTWVLAIVIIGLVRRFVSDEAAAVVSAIIFVWVIGSWVIPPALRRWYRYRGVR